MEKFEVFPGALKSFVIVSFHTQILLSSLWAQNVQLPTLKINAHLLKDLTLFTEKKTPHSHRLYCLQRKRDEKNIFSTYDFGEY